jgi:hypothetical protein
MKEMVPTFARIRDREEQLGHNNRVLWGNKLLSYLDHLENEFFRKPCVDTEDGRTLETCNFKENLEALVSFIDLNLSGKVRATLIDKQGQRADFTKNSLFWNYSDLGELRRCIQTYLYLALIGPTAESPLLGQFIDQLVPDDTLITFNYDLIVEKALYSRNLWNPGDGYGIEFQNIHRICESMKFKTLIPLYKLHGSLNWEHSAIRLRFFYDDRSPIFPGYLEDERSPLRGPYQGKHNGNWIMPSFVKEFGAPGLLSVWTKALTAIRRSDEVIVIGYSLPEADSAASLLLGTSGVESKRLTLVNPQVDCLQTRYKGVTGKNEIVSYTDLGAYVSGQA